MNPAWATEPASGAAQGGAAGGASPASQARTWDPEFTLKQRPASGPVAHERHSLAYELREAARKADAAKANADATAAAATANAAANASLPLDDEADPNDSVESKEAYRYERQYHDWYYAQHPRDPRVPPPLGKPPAATGNYGNGAQAGSAKSKDPALTSPAGGTASIPPTGSGPAHPLASLRKPVSSKAHKNEDAAVAADTPPPLKGLGAVGNNPNNSGAGGGGEGSGRFGEASVSLGPGADPLAAPDDALEGSAATWIDGLPLPSVVGQHAGVEAGGKHHRARRDSEASSKGGSSTASGRARRANKRGAPSPLLRQFKEESAAGSVRTPNNTLSQSGANRASSSAPKASTEGGGNEATGPLSLNVSAQDAKNAAGPTTTSSESGTPVPPGATSTTPPSASKTPFQEPYVAPRSVWDLTAVSGHIVEFACDQEGSRLIQQLSEDSFSLSAIFCEVHDALPMLVSHQFGNYCAQRLLELGQPTHKLAVMGALRGRMAQLALDTYGCRVIQRALDTFTDETVDEMVNLAHELDTAIPDLVIDQNGNHVVQKLMDKLPPHRYGTTALISAFVGRMHDVGMHCYGCRVIQKLFETCGDGARFVNEPPQYAKHLASAKVAMETLVQDVLHHMGSLVVNQYGNYVVQHLISSGSRETRSKAIALLTPRIPELSVNKFSSNVVERLLKCTTDAERDNVIAVLCTARTFAADSVPPIVEMTRDKFANYVIQRLVELATPSQKQTMIGAVGPNINEIKTTTYGVHILSRLERIGWIPPGSSGIAPTGGPMGHPGSMRGGGRGRGGRGGRGRGGHDNASFGGNEGGHGHHHHQGGRGGGGDRGGFHGGQPHSQHHHHQQQHSHNHSHNNGSGGFGGSMPQQQHQQQFQQQNLSWGGAGASVAASYGGGGGGAPGPYGGQQHQHHGMPHQQHQHQQGQNLPVYAQQYASLQYSAPQHQQQQQQQPLQQGAMGYGGGQQQQTSWGAPQQQQQQQPPQGSGAPIDVSRFSTEDLLSALNFLQQQRAMGQTGPMDPQQQAALAHMAQQQQQPQPPQQQQNGVGGGGPRHHDPYRPGGASR